MVAAKLVRFGSVKLTHSGSTPEYKQHRNASGSEEDAPASQLSHQESRSDKPASSKKLERETSKKLQEQWDKELPEVPLSRIIRKNAPEWWIIALGLLGSMVSGAISTLFSIFLGKTLGVFSNPPDKVLPLVHPWAGLFLALACVTAISNLSKVCVCVCVCVLCVYVLHTCCMFYPHLDAYFVLDMNLGGVFYCGW